jgi:hypothetical protein
VSTAVVVAGALSAGGESKKSGPIGLAVILVLCVACYFLVKSMSKHLRKVREEFPTDAPAQGGELSSGPGRPSLSKHTGAPAPAAEPAAQPPESPPPDDPA